MLRNNSRKCRPHPLVLGAHCCGQGTGKLAAHRVSFGYFLATTITRCEHHISLVGFRLEKGKLDQGVSPSAPEKDPQQLLLEVGRGPSISALEAQGPGVVLLAAGFSPQTASPLTELGQLLPKTASLALKQEVSEKTADRSEGCCGEAKTSQVRVQGQK